jgi:hypothetical protein
VLSYIMLCYVVSCIVLKCVVLCGIMLKYDVLYDITLFVLNLTYLIV